VGLAIVPSTLIPLFQEKWARRLLVTLEMACIAFLVMNAGGNWFLVSLFWLIPIVFITMKALLDDEKSGFVLLTSLILFGLAFFLVTNPSYPVFKELAQSIQGTMVVVVVIIVVVGYLGFFFSTAFKQSLEEFWFITAIALPFVTYMFSL
jgi:uncharacterized membrane protein YhaH (DUF805 family)